MIDAKIGQTLIYEFDIEVGGVVLPLKLSEEIKTWRFLHELPPSNHEAGDIGKEEEYKALVEVLHPEAHEAVLEPFQLAGPVELWIQDAKQLRLAVPHDVEAGVLKRVLLADGAVVTVTGARELSLARPLQFPLPLIGQAHEGGLASSLLNLASRLRYSSRPDGQPLLSLRVVGPTSLVAAASKESDVTTGKLKVKRLAPGSVELVARQQEGVLNEPVELLQAPSISTNPWVWPLPSLNSSDAKLLSLEQALKASLGPAAYRKGTFKLLRARASAASFIHIQFELEKTLSTDAFDSDMWPDWATKPAVQKVEFEILAKVEGDKILPVSARQLDPHAQVVALSSGEMNSNATLTKTPPFLPVIKPMTLDLDWEGIMD
ncbi:hypothetical protein O6H91_12G026900 [Diphasiastrum complanatum]|nr:hypothetical protein O6H91_12G026900 [Diphasiastrum complanatum]